MTLEPSPLVVAVTAHRNLVEQEVPRITQAVRTFFKDLMSAYPNTPVTLMSALAEGGDLLAARVASELGLDLIVPLPMPLELYREDFTNPDALAEFEDLSSKGRVIELPLVEGSTPENCTKNSFERNRQYGQMGIFLSSHCQILLALWDGKPSDSLGGTAQVVDYHMTDSMPGLTALKATTQQLLGRDENDLVYHVVCSRDEHNGKPETPLKPLEAYWLSSDRNNPRTTEMTEPYRRVFNQMELFHVDAKRHWPKISQHDADLVEPDTLTNQRDVDTNKLFKTADWLANYYHKRMRYSFRATYTLAIGMGLAFIIYGNLPENIVPLYIFLFLFVIGVGLFRIAQHRDWHRKYLDYRALAEGTRVQFYWQLAGIAKGSETQFAHDNFLQKKEVDLGWIRNVMRASSIPKERIITRGRRIDEVAQAWVKDRESGQLSYYSRKALQRDHMNRVTHLVGMSCLWTGICIAIALAVFHGQLSSRVEDPLLVLTGILPLIAGIVEAYTHKSAGNELVKQYQYMQRIFDNAKYQLDKATTDQDKRTILKALGDSALEEHTEWILMHRERPLEHGKL
ncbi:MAG: hypothetical protein AB8G18_02160 [Gammaproteobacteria bacterium]